MKNKVTIIIPVYKNIFFLNKSLASAVNQTYKNTEIILVNDGNTKDDRKKIYEVIKKFKKKIILLNLKKNQGVSNALNIAIKKSTGDYISWLSHDDYFHLKKTEIQLKFLEKKKAKICSCDFIEINKIKNFKIYRELNYRYFEDQVISIILNDSMHGCSLLIDKNCFKKFSFNTMYKHIQDYDLWHNLSEKYQFIHLNKKLLFTNKHLRQNSFLRKKESHLEKIKFYKYLIKEKLLIYNFSHFSYVIKFIYRSLFIYYSPKLAFLAFSKFVFYVFYNYYYLYIKKMSD